MALRTAAIALIGSTVVAAGCSGDRAGPAPDRSVSGEIVVFAAASLSEAFTDVGASFQDEHPGTSVVFSFAASSELVAQLIEGAPADVLASADMATMNRLTDAGANSGEPVVFASTVPEIIVAEGNPLGIDGVADLADPDLIVVTCAPQVPCGSYAEQIFESAGVEVTPDSYEENANAVVTKVRLGEADAGITYATDIEPADDAVDGVEIPTELRSVAEYPIVVTTEAANPAGGRAFVEFVLSATGREILDDHGFSTP